MVSLVIFCDEFFPGAGLILVLIPMCDFYLLGGTTGLEAMASMHIDDMLSVQKRGPYVLAGQSLGGMTSMEVALQARWLLTRGCDYTIESTVTFNLHDIPKLLISVALCYGAAGDACRPNSVDCMWV